MSSCDYFGVDRAYALKVDRHFVFDLNVEWWRPDIPPQTTPVLELPIDAQRFWFRVLRSGMVVHIPDVDHADDTVAGAVNALQHDGVQSILFLPLLARGTTVGFLGLEARRSKCSWSDESIALMRTVGELFVSAVERSRAEQALELTAGELEQRNKELERSNRELEQFASIVSHDLKSPLQVVRGFVELLGREVGTATPTQTQTYVSAALRGADRMEVLIDDLLVYSRAGQRPTNFVPIDLSQLVTDVLADGAALASGTGASITVEPLPTVAGDATQLRQLLQNLVNNALEVPAPRRDARDLGHRFTGQWLVDSPRRGQRHGRRAPSSRGDLRDVQPDPPGRPVRAVGLVWPSVLGSWPITTVTSGWRTDRAAVVRSASRCRSVPTSRCAERVT